MALGFAVRRGLATAVHRWWRHVPSLGLAPLLLSVSALVSSTTTRPLTPRPPEPLSLHAPRRAPQASWFLHSLASQAMWLYVLCLCVRHGPHALFW